MPTKNYQVRDSLAAEADYGRIEDFLFESTGSTETAAKLVRQTLAFVQSLEAMPHKGTKRDDLFPGLRGATHNKIRVAFMVDDEGQKILVLRVFYGGEDIDTVLAKLGETDT